MKRPEQLETMAAQMRQRMAACQDAEAQVASPAMIPKSTIPPFEPVISVEEAAKRIGVHVATARNVLANEPGVRRFSIRANGEVIYPDTPPKRGRRVRFTYIIPESVVERVIRRMGGVVEDK